MQSLCKWSRSSPSPKGGGTRNDEQTHAETVLLARQRVVEAGIPPEVPGMGRILVMTAVSQNHLFALSRTGTLGPVTARSQQLQVGSWDARGFTMVAQREVPIVGNAQVPMHATDARAILGLRPALPRRRGGTTILAGPVRGRRGCMVKYAASAASLHAMSPGLQSPRSPEAITFRAPSGSLLRRCQRATPGTAFR